MFGAPAITSVAPNAGPTGGGNTVTINGSGFVPGAKAKFSSSGSLLSTTFVSSTQLKVVAPAHAAGVVDVFVTTPAGTSAQTSVDLYAFGAPAITSVAPNAGPTGGGNTVTIKGSGFVPGAKARFLSSGSLLSTTFVSSTQLKVVAPAHAAQLVDVFVTTPAGTSPATVGDRYTFEVTPAISGLSPNVGPTGGGNTVTINGSGFVSGATVKFSTAGSSLPTTFVSSTQLKVVAPAHAAGAVDVFVTTPGGTSAVATSDRYTFDPLTVGSVSYSGAVGNTTFGVGTSPAPPSTSTSGTVLSNSNDADGDTLSAVAGTITTAHGGSVAMTSNGTFTYHPPTDFAGGDTFTFHVSDGKITSPGTATVTVAHMVWYVNDTLGTNGSGTSTSPFNTLSSVNPVSGTGDYIFLFGSATNYANGIALKPGQTLVGQSVGLVIGGETVVSASGSNPRITNSGGAGVTLGEGARVGGVTVSGTSGAGITGAVNDATINSSVSITATTGYGLAITGGSGGTISDAAAISNSSGHAVQVAGRSGGTVNQTGAVTGSVNLSSNTGAAINFSGGIIASTGADGAFAATGGGTVTVTGSGNSLATTTATALDVENTTIGASGLRFKSVSAGSSSAGPVHGIYLVGTGTTGGVSVTGDGSTTVGGDGSGGTIDATGNGTTDNAAIEIGTPQSTTSTTPVPVGPMSFANMKVQEAGTASYAGVFAANVSTFTFAYSTITNEGVGLKLTGYGSSNGQFNVVGNKVTGSAGSAIDVFYQELDSSPETSGTTGTDQGYINNNTVGNPSVANSGSTGGEGIDAFETGTGTLTVDIEHNSVYQVERSYGINAATGQGGGALNVTLTSNTVTMEDTTTSLDAVYVQESTPSSLCTNATGNTFTAAGIADDSGFDATGFLIGSASPSPLVLQGYTGPSDDSGGQVETYLATHPGPPNNILSGHTASDQAFAGSDTAGPPDFVNGTCSTSFGSAPAIGRRPSATLSGPTRVASTASAASPTATSAAATARRRGLPKTQRRLHQLRRGAIVDSGRSAVRTAHAR
jgi:hypothetical protein